MGRAYRWGDAKVRAMARKHRPHASMDGNLSLARGVSILLPLSGPPVATEVGRSRISGDAPVMRPSA